MQIKNTGTNATHTTVTNSQGEYSFPNLDIGSYVLQVKKNGFTTYVQSGIVLQVNTNPAIMVTLNVGSVTNTVTVEAGAAMVETQTDDVSQVINPQQVIDLPLNGRQAEQLITLSGAAVNTNGAGGSVNTLDYPTAASFSIAGSQPNATNFFLDGAQHLDFRTDVALPMPFPDALSEFSVNISAMPADLGMHPGGVVNAVTRTGTNTFHGGLFDFVRNGVMDSTTRTFASRSGAPPPGARDTLVRNQFGGELGGPIVKDKLFFFGGYQGTMANSTTAAAQNSAAAALPTPAMMSGDLSALLPASAGAKESAVGCNVQTVNSAYTTAPGNNQLQPGVLQTSSAGVMANFMKDIPSSDFFDPCGDYAYQAAPLYNFENQMIGRVDWHRTSSDSIFGRYFVSKYSQPSYYNPGNLLSSNGIGLADQIQTVAIGDDHVLNARSINTVRLSFDRTATQRTSNPGIPTLCTLGANATCQVKNNIDLIIGVKPGFEGYDYENSYGVTEGYAWTNGKHQFNAGFTWMHVQMNGEGTFQMNPEPSFSSATTGATFGDEVTGNVDSVSQGMGQLSRDGENQPSAFVQDAYKILPRLQLTGGMRWDPFYAQHNGYGMVGDFSLLGYYAGTESQQYVNAPPGMTFEGDPGFHGHSDTNNYPLSFAPRFGFVWDVTGKGTETLRGGYGIFYDTSVLWNTMHVVLDPPWGETLSFVPLSVANGGGLANMYAGVNGPNPFPFYAPPKSFTFPVNGTFVFENQANKPENVQQWNLSLQRQLTGNLLLTVNYLGNKTSHVWLGISQNSAQYLPQYGATGSCTLPWGASTYTFKVCNEPSGITEYDSTHTVTDVNARRALNLAKPQYGPLLQGGVTTASAWGDGAYNALLVSLEKRMSHSFSVLGNFTWSRCMDDGEIGQDIGDTPMNPLDPKGSSWGDCTYNNKDIANLNVVGETPRFQNRAANDLLTNWNGSAIFSAQTGSNYDVVDNYDISLVGNSTTGSSADRPNVVGNPNKGGTVAANPTCSAPSTVHTAAYWFNPCAFGYASPGTFGNEVRNSLVGPANWNLNLAIWRGFSLPERISLDFRAEAFNALNHTQFGDPTATLATNGSNLTVNSNAGLVSSSNGFYTPRIMQLAIKANF